MLLFFGIFAILNTYRIKLSQVDRHIRKLDSDLARFEEDLKQQRQSQIQETQECECLK